MLRRSGRPPPLSPATGVSVFGKVPALGDFVRVGAGSPVVRAFESWVTTTLAFAASGGGKGWEGTFAEGKPLLFLYRTSKDPTPIAGAMAPSRDSVGRVFPLVVACPLDIPSTSCPPPLVPIVLQDFGVELLRAFGTMLSAGSASELEAVVGRLESPSFAPVPALLEKYERWVRATNVSAIWQALYGASGNAAAQTALGTIVEVLAPFRGQEALTTPLSVRVPLPPSDEATCLAFWVDLIRTYVRWQTTLPTYFLSESERGKVGVIQIGDPPQGVLRELWQPNPESDYVCDLTYRAGSPPPLRPRFSPQIDSAMRSPDATVHDLLTALAS